MAVKSKSFWRYRQKSRLAEMVKIKKSHLSEILHRRRGVGPDMADRLEHASYILLGTGVPFREWVLNKRSLHPAFSGNPKTN